jgi:uncharacterized protein (TIGR03437 family)
VTGPSAAVVTRLNAAGSELVASTFLAGNYSGGAAGVRLDADGNPLVFGQTASTDFPATGVWRTRCGPWAGQPRFFQGIRNAARSDAVAGRVFRRAATTSPCRSVGLIERTGSLATTIPASSSADLALAPQARVVQIDLTDGSSPVACVVNGASMLAENAVVPGQLLTIFGEGLGPDGLLVFESAGELPVRAAGTEVRIGGMPAPLLALSAGQINLVAPSGVTGTRATVEVIRDGRSVHSWLMGLTYANPSPLLRYGLDGSLDLSENARPQLPLADAINEDGTVNNAGNPATAGSVVTVYATGFAATPAPSYVATGYGVLEDVEVAKVPGRTSAVWQVRFRVPPQTSAARLAFRLGPPVSSRAPMSNFIYVQP